MVKLAFAARTKNYTKTAIAFTYGLFRWGAPLAEVAIAKGNDDKIIQTASYKRIYRLLKETHFSEALQDDLTACLLLSHRGCFGNPPLLKDAAKLEYYADDLLRSYRGHTKVITGEHAQMNLVKLRRNRSLGECIDLIRSGFLTHPAVRDAIRDEILSSLKNPHTSEASLADIRAVERIVGNWETKRGMGLELVG